jgi:signal transduction histidine kinase
VTAAPPKKSVFAAILDPLTGTDLLRREKARLEAFLSAVPGEYCGFAADGSVAYSEGFKNLLRLPQIANIHDIQGALSTSDAAVLEGRFFAMKEPDGKPFQITVTSADGAQIFRLSGSKGAALDGADAFDILWIEDVTDAQKTLKTLQQNLDAAERESRVRQATLDTLPLPLWQRGADGSLQWCNRAYAGLMNITPAEAVARQQDVPCTPRDKSIDHLALSRQALETRETRTAGFHVIVNGKRLLLQKKETPLPGMNATIGLSLDLTDQESAQAELLRSQSANKQLLEQLRTAIAFFAADQTLEFYNSSFAQLWSLDDSWLHKNPKLGDILEKLREIRKLPEQADFRKYKQGWLDMFTRLIDPYEDMMYLPDGSALRLLAMPHPMGGLMVTFEDVTSRLELESSYNTLIAVQKETLDNLAEGVAAFGGDGRLRLYNPAFTRLWSLHPEDVEGTPHISRLAARMALTFAEDKAAAAREEIAAHALRREAREGHMRRRDGSLVEYATVSLPDGGTLVSYIDITDKAKVENALREKNAALEAAEQLKTDFLANVSYQLRTPLSSIMGFAEILDHEYFGGLNAKQKEYTVGIQSAGQRLVGLIDDILDLSSIEAGYMELEKTMLDTHAMLRNVQELTQDWAHKKKLNIRVLPPVDPVRLWADERRIKQILVNLVRNAIAHTPEGGEITLSSQKSGDDIHLGVTDTGIGIAPDMLPRIFTPFERGSSSGTPETGAERGAGLGLTLVKNIIELHGGQVSVDSTPGAGTKFMLHFPNQKDQDQ